MLVRPVVKQVLNCTCIKWVEFVDDYTMVCPSSDPFVSCWWCLMTVVMYCFNGCWHDKLVDTLVFYMTAWSGWVPASGTVET